MSFLGFLDVLHVCWVSQECVLARTPTKSSENYQKNERCTVRGGGLHPSELSKGIHLEAAPIESPVKIPVPPAPFPRPLPPPAELQ